MSRNKIKVTRPMIVKVHDENAWYVASDSDPDTMYKVTLHSCECKAFEYRDGYCKHQDRIMTMLSNGMSELLQGDKEEKQDLVKLLELSIKLAKERKEKSVIDP